MTTKERTVLQNFFNQMETYRKIESETLEQLKDINEREGDGHRWCSWYENLEGIRKNSPSEYMIHKAERLYEEYLKAEGKYQLLCELGQDLAELSFWKPERLNQH